MSDDEHDQFGFDEDDEMMEAPRSGAPWFLQEPWTFIAGFVVVGGALTLLGRYLNALPPKKIAARPRR